MENKNKIEKKIKKKTNPFLVKTLIHLKKKNPKIAKELGRPKRSQIKFNLRELNEKCKDGEKILIPGILLGAGELEKKVKIVCWSFSKSAEEKAKKSKSEIVTIVEEIKKNPELKELKMIK